MSRERNPLWKEYNLAENNPDQGGGILYALRYSKEKIEQQREQLVGVLQKLGARIEEDGEGVQISVRGRPTKSKARRLGVLVEELSVVNEASEYKQAGLDEIQSIKQLKDILTLNFFSLLQDRNTADAYNLVSMFIPRLVADLKLSKAQNKTLTSQDTSALEDLDRFARYQSETLNNPRGLVMMGGRGPRG